MTTTSSSGSEIAPEIARNWWPRTSQPSEVGFGEASRFHLVPMSRNIDFSTNDSFKIDLMIPSIGKIDQGWLLLFGSVIARQRLHCQHAAAAHFQLCFQRQLLRIALRGAGLLPRRRQRKVDGGERVKSRPPRNFCCIRCDRNGHWSHKCNNTQKKSICSRCQGDHFIDVCPYRADVGPAYECKEWAALFL